MTPLEIRIADLIRSGGPMSVTEYMRTSLADPDHGYYVTRDPLGAAGDFTTAPEISQMFGELIGLWCVDVWQKMDRPSPFDWVELGPGRGTLMADAVRAAQVLPDFLEDGRLTLVETSPMLKERQRQALAEAPLPVAWTDTFDADGEAPLLLIANEFLDALPIRQFERTADGWRERQVALDGEAGFRFATGDTVMEDQVPAALRDTPTGAIFETCPDARDLVAAVADRIARSGGAALFIDYGHPVPALGETLQAVRGHAYHRVLTDAGEADLTAHVDFGALADSARDAGASVLGPVDQGRFLQAIGIERRTEALVRTASPDQIADIASALNRLTAPGPNAMGRLFKAMAVHHPDMVGVDGFGAAMF